jgi:GTP-binding protein
MIDASMGMERQDLSLIKIIERKKKGLVILVNKWDLAKKETNTAKDFEEEIKKRTAPFTDVPVLFISALTKQRIYKSIETALDVYKNRQKKIPTSKLNDALLPIIERTPPPSARGQYIKVKYITQVNASTPTFVFFTNFPQLVKQPYKNFLENRIRELFDFTGVIINIVFKKK